MGFLKVLSLVIAGLLWLVGLKEGLGLLSEPSTVSVLLGVIATAALVCAPVFYWGRVKEWIKGDKLAWLALASMMLLPACTRVEPGKVGIKVNQVGSERGVSDYTLTTGLVLYVPGLTSVYEYPTYTQTTKLEGDSALTFNSKEGTVFRAPVSISYSLDAAKVPAFYVKFRSDDLNTFTHGFLRNIVRDAVADESARYTAEEIYADKREEIRVAAQKRITDQVGAYGVVIEQFGFLGAPEPPDAIKEAITAKTSAIQNAIRVENEVRQTRAEAQKAVAMAEGEAQAKIAKATGEAKANQLLAASISQQLLEWRRLEITAQAVERWNGQRPQVEGSAGGLLLNLNGK